MNIFLVILDVLRTSIEIKCLNLVFEKVLSIVARVCRPLERLEVALCIYVFEEVKQ
jgi:hypothetical protein